MPGRIRTIKPDFFLDEEIAALDPLDRLAFIGLWCAADKAGRLEDRPARLAVQILPYDKGDFSHRISRLAEATFIVRYKDDKGRRFIQIRTWDKHQRPHHTEPPSVIPEPPPPSHGEDTVTPPFGNGDLTDGREGKGMERNGRERKRVAFAPPTDDEWLEYVAATYPAWPRPDALSAHGYYESRGWHGVRDWHACAKTCYHRWAGKSGIRPDQRQRSLVGAHLPTAKPSRSIDEAPPELQAIARRIFDREDVSDEDSDRLGRWLNGEAA